jgi:hypothetical protein
MIMPHMVEPDHALHMIGDIGRLLSRPAATVGV